MKNEELQGMLYGIAIIFWFVALGIWVYTVFT